MNAMRKPPKDQTTAARGHLKSMSVSMLNLKANVFDLDGRRSGDWFFIIADPPSLIKRAIFFVDTSEAINIAARKKLNK